MSPIWNGIKSGFVLALLIGPVFFSLIQTSIERGFRRGAAMAVGISLSDFFYIFICYFGLLRFFSNGSFKTPMAYIGGITLILFGLYYVLYKARKAKIQSAGTGLPEAARYRNYVLKGFIINGFNPMVPIFWIATISVATVDMGYSNDSDILTFFGALLVTVLCTDLLKAYLAHSIRQHITEQFLRTMNLLVGIFLFGFGIWLLYKAYWHVAI